MIDKFLCDNRLSTKAVPSFESLIKVIIIVFLTEFKSALILFDRLKMLILIQLCFSNSKRKSKRVLTSAGRRQLSSVFTRSLLVQ